MDDLIKPRRNITKTNICPLLRINLNIIPYKKRNLLLLISVVHDRYLRLLGSWPNLLDLNSPLD